MKHYAILSVFILALACGGPVDEPSSEEPYMSSQILGRWDVTARGEDAFPLWFELVEQDGAIQGRFQRRFGHAIPIDIVEISGEEMTLQIEGDTYTGSLRGDQWEDVVVEIAAQVGNGKNHQR